MNVEELFNKCMAGKHRDSRTITAKTVYNYCISPFLIWCDYYAPADERDPVNPYLHLLADRARAAKQKKLSRTDKSEYETFTTGFKNALNAFKKGVKESNTVPLFYLQENLFGICDLAVKDESHPSIFGNHHYTIIDIRNAKRIKQAYIMQAAFYTYLIGLIQEHTPAKFGVMDKQGRVREYKYEKYHAELMKCLEGIKEIQRGKNISPTVKSCKWPWTRYCTKKAIELDDVSIVPAVGRTVKEELNKNGIFTVTQLAYTREDFGIKDFDKIQKHAQAYVEGKPQILKRPKLPKSETELYIDIESTDELDKEEGTIKVDYLIGVLLCEQGKIEYKHFICEDLKSEPKMVKEFFAWISRYKDHPIYHYGPFESIHLTELGRQHGFKEKLNLIDLLTMVRKCTAFPTISQSLKDIAKYLGFKWRNNTDAQESIALYLQYLETKDHKILKKIIQYNEDDVKATKIIKEYLESIQ